MLIAKTAVLLIGSLQNLAYAVLSATEVYEVCTTKKCAPNISVYCFLAPLNILPEKKQNMSFDFITLVNAHFFCHREYDVINVSVYLVE